ncbi:hypothetical protein KR044_004823 [Drosophila immigrans]|nr:hypothetical protein KR044_004823 [Drosophila immigrans]
MEQPIAHVLASGEQRTSDVASGSTSFEQLHLDKAILRTLEAHKFQTPTKIQAAAIPMALAGMDLLVQSKSGTGKTLIYLLAALQALDKTLAKPQVLIIVPTRELAIQVEDTANGLSFNMKNRVNYVTVSYIGGTDVKKDRIRMAKARIVVGTPGRLLHLLHNNVFNTSAIKLIVLDEADQLYATQSLQKDVQSLLQALPKRSQIIACSATYPNELDERLAKAMHQPILISNSERATVLLGIRQFVYELPEQLNSLQEMMAKLSAVRKIFDQLPYEQGILFASSQSRADSYRNYLQRNGVACDLMSGAMKQSERLETFQAYRNFKTRTMVATDLMARGVDSSHANLVINLDPPKDLVTYLHRIGRAGRFGSKGIAITFITSPQQCQHFKRIVAEAGTGMSVLQFPTEPRADFNFWDFESYDLPYFQKLEAHEQAEDELKRITQRWKNSPQQSNQASNNKTQVNVEPSLKKNIKIAEELQQTEDLKWVENMQHAIKNKNLNIEEITLEEYVKLRGDLQQTTAVINLEAAKQQCEKQPELELKKTNEKANAVHEKAVNLEFKTNLTPDKPCDQMLIQQSSATNKEEAVEQVIQLENIESVNKSPEQQKSSVETTFSVDNFPAAAPNSINTKTYLLMPDERSSTTLIPLGISNTVDDASSIISDSMENDYDSDASYSSTYSMSDARLVWRRMLVQRKFQKRCQRVKRSTRYFNWHCKQKFKKEKKKKQSMKSSGKPEEEQDESTMTSCLLIVKRFDAIRLLGKFDNLSRLRLNAYFEVFNFNLQKSTKYMDQLYDAMIHIYYVDRSKPRVPNKSYLPDPCDHVEQNKLIQQLNPNPAQLPRKESNNVEKPKLLERLSVHVNHQINILPVVVAPDLHDAEEIESDLSSSDMGSEGDDGDSLEPYSSGFVESTESASSGIETSQYGSDSSTEMNSGDDEDEDEEEEENEEEEEEYEDEEVEEENESDDDEGDNETDESSELSLYSSGSPDSPDTDNKDAAEPESDNEEVSAQVRWKSLFEMQYQFISNYVNNYMETYSNE